MSWVRRSSAALGASALGAWLAAGAQAEPQPTPEAPAQVAAGVSVGREALGPDATYLVPNVEDTDGTPGYIHVTPRDMPLRVSIGYPQIAPRFGSRKDAREVAIEAMREWEDKLQPHLPWFALEFVDKDRSAPVQVIWKRRITGPYGGFGGLRYTVTEQGLRVGGMMEISTTPNRDESLKFRLSLDKIHLLVAHEFGHILGLMHCLDCDSAMNYSWHTLERVIVTDTDVRTFMALVAQPNGYRVDGRRLSFLPEDVVPSEKR